MKGGSGGQTASPGHRGQHPSTTTFPQATSGNVHGGKHGQGGKHGPGDDSQQQPLTRNWAFAFHLFAFLVFLHGYLWHFSPAAKVLPGATGWGWFYRYLTFWGFTGQLLALALAVITHTMPKCSWASRVADDLFCAMFGIAHVVFLMYWTLVLTMEKAVEGSSVDRPWWLNLTVHTLNVVVAWVDLFAAHRSFRPFSLNLSIFIAAAYLAFMSLCMFKNKVWPYPFLNVLRQPDTFIATVIVGLVIIVAFFHLGRFVRLADIEAQARLKRIKGL